MKTLLKNCRLVSPDVDIPSADIGITDGFISGVSEHGSDDRKYDQVVDVKGNIAAPGFIDIHCHGRSGFDFCDGTLEAFRTIGKDKLEDGVTSFLATTLSVSKDDLRKTFRAASEYSRMNKGGANLLGIHLEGPFFNPECAGAQNPKHLLPPDISLVDELNAIHPIRIVSFSPELEGSIEFTGELVKRGIMPSGAHSATDYECFMKERSAGMKHLTHFCNVMTPLHHLRFGMVGGGLLHNDVMVEMICDGVHLCDEMIRLISLLKKAEGMMLITDAMCASAMPDGDYSLGGLPVKVSNGRATIESGKVAGSTLRYHDGLKRLVSVTGLPLCEAIKCTSWNQARSLGFKNLGKLETGYKADIVILNPNLDPVTVFSSGKIMWSKE